MRCMERTILEKVPVARLEHRDFRVTVRACVDFGKTAVSVACDDCLSRKDTHDLSSGAQSHRSLHPQSG